MTDPRVNRYRSGAKHPEREVITSENDDGSFTFVAFDAAKATIKSHTFPGDRNIDVPEVDQGPE